MNYSANIPEAYCYKKEFIHKPEEWEIVDKKYKEKVFKYLFTFHLLPLSARRKRDILSKRILNQPLTETKCDMFIRLVSLL